MKKLTKAFFSLALCLCLVLSAGLTACGGNNGNNGGNESHKCEHVCTECDKCLSDCEEPECADKCQGHTPPHACEDVCPECHKCLTDCEEPECADKCQGHTPPHECEDICPECHKCLTDCEEPECEEKCEGHVVGTPISVAAGGTYNMPISGISAGVHIIEADLGSTMLDTGRLQAFNSADTRYELVYSEARSSEGHNVYFGFIKIAEGDTSIIFSAVTESVNASVVIKDYEMPTLKADGVAVEIPANLINTADADLIKIKLDSTVTDGSYTFCIDGSKVNGGVKVTFGSTVSDTIGKTKYGNEQAITISGLETGSQNYAYIMNASSSATYSQICPITIYLKPAA